MLNLSLLLNLEFALSDGENHTEMFSEQGHLTASGRSGGAALHVNLS